MVRKEQCPQCKGNRNIAIDRNTGKDPQIKCPGVAA